MTGAAGRADANPPPTMQICGIGEDHAQQRTPQAALDRGKPRRVVAGDAPFIRGFMQHRRIVARVSGDKDGRTAALQGGAVVDRHAAGVERQRGIFKPELVDVGRPAGGRDQVRKSLGLGASVQCPIGDDHLVAVAGDLGMGVGIEVELLGEHLARAVDERGMRQGPDAAAPAEHLHPHAQTMQCLPKLEADHSGAENGDAFRELGPFEDVLVGREAVAEGAPGERKDRRGTGGDDDAGRLHQQAIVDPQRPVIDKGGTADELVGVGEGIDVVGHECHEPVALESHALHHRPAIDLDRNGLHSERGKPCDGMRGFGRGDQQLARHASHSRAGRAVFAAFDQEHTLARELGGAIRRQAGGPRADDGYVGLDARLRRCHCCAFVTFGSSTSRPVGLGRTPPRVLT